MLQDFLATIRNLKWDFYEDINMLTTIAPLKNDSQLSESEKRIGALTVTDENTMLICKPGSIVIDDLCGKILRYKNR